jgi:hypothetical protein
VVVEPSFRGAPSARIASTTSPPAELDAAWTVTPPPVRHAHASIGARHEAAVPGADAASPPPPTRGHDASPKRAHLPLAELPALPRAALDAIRAQPAEHPDGAWLAAGLALMAALLIVRTNRRRTV